MANPKAFDGLLDFCIDLESDPEAAGNIEESFRRVLGGFFFGEETAESKPMSLYFSNLQCPGFLGRFTSLIDVDVDELSVFIDGETVNTSLAGKIMLSPQYLKAFYPHHPPSFNQLPPDVRQELLDKIKQKNADMRAAFEKMKRDVEADRGRKVLTLVAMILKAIHYRTEFPLNKLSMKAEDAIRAVYGRADEVFKASSTQLAELRDDSKIKELVKTFFAVRKFQDIAEMSDIFKQEFERLKNRTLRASR